MSSEITRATHSLFPADGKLETHNVKFFLGHDRAITGEQLAEQLNRADAQVREGLAMPSPKLDGELTTKRILG